MKLNVTKISKWLLLLALLAVMLTLGRNAAGQVPALADWVAGQGVTGALVFAAAYIVHSLIFGVECTLRVVPASVLRFVAAAGVLLYAGTGVASMLLGANFLDYNVLAASPTGGQHLGILLVEFGVGLTVASVMMLVYFTFAGWSEST